MGWQIRQLGTLQSKRAIPPAKGIRTILNAAIGDMAGNPIIKNKATGEVWDHLDDITGHMRALNRQIKRLNREINSGTFGGDVLEEALELRGKLQKDFDAFYAALQRASKKYKNVELGSLRSKTH